MKKREIETKKKRFKEKKKEEEINSEIRKKSERNME